MRLIVRAARPDEATVAASLMRRSIECLCVEDHRNDDETIAEWTSKRGAEIVLRWIENPANRSAVAIDDQNEVVGFAMLNDTGEVLLLYVLPEAIRCGIGSALLRWIENEAKALDLSKLHVDTSLTALPFYESHGFSCSGDRTQGFGITFCHPMEKTLL